MNSRAQRIGLLGILLLLPSCDDGVEPHSPVAFIQLSPGDTLLAPGDSLRFTAVPLGTTGEPLEGVALRFRLGEGSPGELSELGVFRATDEGTSTVIVEAPRGTWAAATVRTSSVTGFSPLHSAFGGVVTVQGSGFGNDTEVRFGPASGRVREIDSEGRSLEVWVPWDATVGPVTVLPDGIRQVAAPGTFYLTGGGDDALEPNGVAVAAPVSFPFHNPFLLTRADDLDHYVFELSSPGPVTVRVIDRGAVPGWTRRVVLQVNEGDDVEEFLGVAPAYSFGRDEPLDGVVSRASVEAGRYAARVFVAGEEVIDRRYEIRMDPVATFERSPDAREPNDYPAEAPEVPLPFTDTLALENPWSVDYLSFRVEERSRVDVTVTTFGPAVGVFFLDGERSVHWHLANGTRPGTWRGSISPFETHLVSCRVEPGTYHVAVVENSGSSGEYALDVRAEPSTTGFLNCVGTALESSAVRSEGATLEPPG